MDTPTEKLASTPLVSVLMVTYNRGSYIQEAIESVLAQTYSNFELVIIDDGSTDETGAIVSSLKNPKIHYFLQEKNAGVCAARKLSVANARGHYLAILDSDDVWNDSFKLEAQVSFLEKNPEHVIVGTFINTITSSGNLLKQSSYFTDDNLIRKNILLRNQFAHSSVLMRTAAVRAAGSYRTVALGEDLDLYLRIGLQGKFANIPSFMTSYRVHNTGLSRDGIKMARSVLGFIRMYRMHYPNALLAIMKSLLVLAVAHLLDTRTIFTNVIQKTT